MFHAYYLERGGLALARGWSRFWLIGIATAALCVCIEFTWLQLGYWRDNFAQWEHTVAVTHRNAFAHERLGTELLDRGRLAKADAEFRAALAIDTTFVPAHLGLGNALTREGQFDEAEKEYRTALGMQPEAALVHHNLATLLADRGFVRAAEIEYRKAIDLAPDLAMAHFGLGAELRNLGRRDEAVAEFRRAIALDPGLIPARNVLGETLLQQGNYAEAEDCIRHTLDLLPSNSPLRQGLLIRQGSLAHWRALEQKLPDALASNKEIKDIGTLLDLAWICQFPRAASLCRCGTILCFGLCSQFDGGQRLAEWSPSKCRPRCRVGGNGHRRTWRAFIRCGAWPGRAARPWNGSGPISHSGTSKRKVMGRLNTWELGGICRQWQVDPDLGGSSGRSGTGQAAGTRARGLATVLGRS